MNDRPCVIIEERRKDTYRDNPITIEERNSLIKE
jgi:hypothetical protein